MSPPSDDALPADRPRALFVHGAGASGAQWAIWRRRFAAAGVASIAPDRTPASAGLEATRFSDHLAQVGDRVAALRDDPGPATLVVGASLGGLLALAAMAATTPPCDGFALVLVNPLPPAPWTDDGTDLPISGLRRAWATQGRFASTDRAMPGRPFPERHAAFHAWRDESGLLLREAYSGLAVTVPPVPVLVIAAEGDTVVPVARMARFADGIGASLLRVPGDHLGPAMGDGAARAAGLALAWWDGVRRGAMPSGR